MKRGFDLEIPGAIEGGRLNKSLPTELHYCGSTWGHEISQVYGPSQQREDSICRKWNLLGKESPIVLALEGYPVETQGFFFPVHPVVNPKTECPSNVCRTPISVLALPSVV